MNKKLFILCFFAFILGLVLLLFLRIIYINNINEKPFRAQKSNFKFKPPSEALEGEVLQIKGDVKREARGDNKFKPIKIGTKILQGEVLRTEENGNATIEFKNFGEINLAPGTELVFVDLIPSEFLLQQTSGTVSYETSKNHIISVRILHALFELDSGSAKTTLINSGKARVEMFSGTGKIGMVDLENNTQVLNLKRGQNVLVNDNDQTLIFTN